MAKFTPAEKLRWRQFQRSKHWRHMRSISSRDVHLLPKKEPSKLDLHRAAVAARKAL